MRNGAFLRVLVIPAASSILLLSCASFLNILSELRPVLYSWQLTWSSSAPSPAGEQRS